MGIYSITTIALISVTGNLVITGIYQASCLSMIVNMERLVKS